MATPDEMTLSSLATIYGCCGLFDLCSDQDLLSLSFSGQNKFLDWIGWEKTNVCRIKKNFITWVRAEEAANVATAGYLSNPCGDDNSVDWGSCDFTLENFALLRRHGPERNATQIGLRLCEAQPRYRLDGSPITNDAEYDMRLVVEAQLQDLKTMIITGNNSTAGQFDGLDRLIKTGYTNSAGNFCRIMDSTIINWNGNGFSGGAGITWNGKAVGSGYGFVDVLIAAVRKVRDRIKMSPALAAQPMSPGNMIFVAPTHILRCLLDSYTCWSVCPGSTNVQVAIQSFEARTFRNNLNGGEFGDGKIFIDGFEIPLCAYDWSLTDAVTGQANAYLLTGAIGNVKVISGQYNDMTAVPAGYPDAGYSYTDGGKFLTWIERLRTCVYREVEFQPRLLMWAPWAQVRFEDVYCDAPGGILSADPWASSFFPETSFSSASCPV